ncbi:transcription factor FapR [Risungbinella massiliensis]|uniref:transcription factor FapR n=1 Tax=Risungbinella massiliensis TaxID=1329796 RepID=UPI0005CBD07C|nr:transcription factor FapR [Risungbinella massiliensis]
MRLTKKERQQQLVQFLEQDPFINDEEMAKRLEVSIQTIRLDRMELGIPELRERMKNIAEERYDSVRSLTLDEVIGEMIELRLDEVATSLLEIRMEHVFSRTRIARGHHLFAQANSLAVALADAKVALTGGAEVRFVRPVRLGERCIARAEVIHKDGNRLQVEVKTRVKDEIVFQGKFDVHRANA